MRSVLVGIAKPRGAPGTSLPQGHCLQQHTFEWSLQVPNGPLVHLSTVKRTLFEVAGYTQVTGPDVSWIFPDIQGVH